jgi:MraZ protein
VLLGEFRHSVDSKGRVHLPARWRDELGSGVIVAQGLERCVFVFPRSRFDDLVEKLRSLSIARKTNRDLSRLLYSSSSEEQMDSQGRITIPPPLREWAALQREVVLAGVMDRAEIWDRSSWGEYKTDRDQEYETIAEALEI